MKFYSDNEIIDVYKMSDAIRDVKNTLIRLNDGKVKTPERTVIPVNDDNVMLYMPSVDVESLYSSIKIISIYPNNKDKNMPATQAVSVITELESGQNVATLEASYLTRLRTGAMTGLATDIQSRKDAKVLGVIGTGGMAFEQALGVLEVRDIERIVLFNRTEEKAHSFKERLETFGVTAEIEVAEDVNKLTEVSDIINTATNSTKAVFDHEYVKSGAHINGLGTYMPHMREINEESIKVARHVIFDDLDAVIVEAGEFIHAVETGDFSWDKPVALKDMIDKEIDRSDTDITIFKSVGTAYYDMSVAIGAYQKLK